ncbi:hypothetical protein RUA4292_00393 [Ruegeria atlantica]|uniref:Uncharacterized protein n=1 Tax=Ruegeria atlantica TaxID=81569 RepID=A0A0N7LPU9_9RHOB|nr:hypothetical protein RUA4292_00393 [Ruegeria atlantica]
MTAMSAERSFIQGAANDCIEPKVRIRNLRTTGRELPRPDLQRSLDSKILQRSKATFKTVLGQSFSISRQGSFKPEAASTGLALASQHCPFPAYTSRVTCLPIF